MNLAGVNKNPFEFYAQLPNTLYSSLIEYVDGVVFENAHPELNVTLSRLMTVSSNPTEPDGDPVEPLRMKLVAAGIAPDEAFNVWWDQWSQKTIVEFLKSTDTGRQRLVSQADQRTSSVQARTRTGFREVHRPSVVTQDDFVFEDLATWWTNWKHFMFDMDVALSFDEDRKPTLDSIGRTCQLIEMMLNAKGEPKYGPPLTLQIAESTSLQILCLALCDAALLHIVLDWQAGLSAADAPRDSSQTYVKARTQGATACSTESQVKQLRAASADVMFLQEVSGRALSKLEEQFQDEYLIVSPTPPTNQMSVVMASRKHFEALKPRANPGWTTGMCVATATDRCYPPREWLLASFHAKSEGTDTPTALEHLESIRGEHFGVLVGLDANTVATKKGTSYTAGAFMDACRSYQYLPHVYKLLRENSSETALDWKKASTTLKARTVVQVQFDKTKSLKAIEKGEVDQNPKDWILVGRGDENTPARFKLHSAARVNNARDHDFDEAMFMPSDSWPSDHAMIHVCFSIVP
jgi:hypothetical protein